jgi:hypothetical protein
MPFAMEGVMRKIIRLRQSLWFVCLALALLVAPAIAYAAIFPSHLPQVPGTALLRIVLALASIAVEVWEWLWSHHV